jgi:hypothetical protein
MTDLEMTKLCAEAMGFPCFKNDLGRWVEANVMGSVYDPLHDDAQAMALVKRFCLDIECYAREPVWTVLFDDNERYSKVRECTDLNRAIVECVANMQKAK